MTRPRTSALLARVLILCLPLVLVPAAVAWGSGPAEDAIAAFNAERSARDRPALVERAELARAAAAFARDLAKRRDTDPARSGDAGLRGHLRRSGYLPIQAFALFGFGYGDADQLARALLDDRADAARLLDPDVGEIGIGHEPGSFRTGDGRIVRNTWVVLLAKTRFPPVPDAASRLLATINRARIARGLQPVVPVDTLAAAAQEHVDDMIARGFFDHVSPDGSHPWDRATRHGYAFRKIGENLAAGLDSPDEVVRDWTASPGHAAIMFDPAFQEIGIGYRAGPLNTGKRSLVHIWAAEFGARR